MTCITHAAQIDLRFRDSAREFMDFRVGAGAGNFARKRLNLSDNPGSESTGRLSAWRSEFRAERALPCLVFGPVLARALARFALILRMLVTPHFFLWLESSRSR